MSLLLASLITKSEIAPGVHLLEVYAPPLARKAQPGQYCMLRCCDRQASDPFLRRPLFIHAIDVAHGLCRFLVYVQGRATAWLARQQVGTELDLLGPLGRGWRTPGPAVGNLLLIGEPPLLAPLICLAHQAIEQELTVVLFHYSTRNESSYPPALLAPEIEYQVLTGEASALGGALQDSLSWADAACCSVSRETLRALIETDARWRRPHFLQIALGGSLPCVSGGCLACQVETQRGLQRVCRDGPIFQLNELVDI